MKKIVPFGFKKGSGYGWRYTWHNDDKKNEFHFECNECIYAKILGRRKLLKLGTMCCHADIINYGDLPYTDFIRTKTICHGGNECDFRFVRHYLKYSSRQIFLSYISVAASTPTYLKCHGSNITPVICSLSFEYLKINPYLWAFFASHFPCSVSANA